MNRLEKKFNSLKKANQAALMPYLTVGDPDIKTTLELVLALEKAGADILELGIPFSDPVADGPTIQAASQRALARGITIAEIFDLVKKVREKSQIPLCFMSYYNPIYHYGLAAFAAKMAEVGVDGLIVPDLPFEEAAPLREMTERYEISFISFVAPTSSSERIKMIVKPARGFIYLVSLTGVTGERKELSEDLGKLITNLRSYANLPICVGFGVSNAEQAKVVAKIADGVIVGSAIINELSKHIGQSDLVEKTATLVKELAKAIKNK